MAETEATLAHGYSWEESSRAYPLPPAVWRGSADDVEYASLDELIILKMFRGQLVEACYARRSSEEDVQSDSLGKSLQLFGESSRGIAGRMQRFLQHTVPSDWHTEAPLNTAISPDDILPVVEEQEWTAERLMQAILEKDPGRDWDTLRKLVLLAEDTDFTPEQSRHLAPRLLDLASAHCESNDPEDGPVVWAAIRTGASMLRPDKAHSLVPLLEAGHRIDTSLVAIKMLGRIFEAQPPGKVDQYPGLADKAKSIFDALANPYSIDSSRSAAMAQLAVYALGAMASSRAIEATRAIRELGIAWFTRRTGRKLKQLREHWENQDPPVSNGVQHLLGEALAELRS